MTDTPKVCSRCRRETTKPGQRYCKACHRVAMRESRRRRVSETEAQRGVSPKSGATGATFHDVSPTTGDELAPFVPYLGHDDVPREPWEDDYLRALAANGKHELAAAAAGVHSSIPRQQRDTDLTFAAEVDLALEFYRDSLEAELRRLGRAKSNPLPYFGLLRSERPTRWLERSAVLSLTADLSAKPLTDADAVALLKAMLANVTPTTRAMLSGAPLEEKRKPETP
jgi:hypothetical protein